MLLGPLPGWRLSGILFKDGLWDQTGSGLYMTLPVARFITLG